MKKILLSGSLALLLTPALAFAANFNDVTITTSAVFNVGGIEVDLNGSSATVASAAVSGTTLSLTMMAGSSASLILPGRNSFTLSGADGIASQNICNSTVSKVTLSNVTTTTTVVMTPSATLCTTPTTSTSSGSGSNGPIAGGGGGGGGGGYVAPVPTTPTSVPAGDKAAFIASLQAQLNALLAQIAALTGKPTGSFSRDLQLGATGADVKALQVYLNTHGYALARSGPGSSGNETTKFGAATRAALVKLQKAAGITPASGYLGAKTRAYIAAHP